MEAQWHFVLSGKQTGPVTLDQLRASLASGMITGDTLVWKAGMAKWTAAREVSEVAPAAGSGPEAGSPAPPPVPPEVAPAAPISGAPSPMPPPLGFAAPTAFSPAPDSNARTMGMLCHLLGIFTGFLGPLVLWLIKRQEIPFVDDQGKEALNFQITMLICYFAGVLGFCVHFLGFLIFLAVSAVRIIFGVMATIESNKGNAYRYPICLRLIT